MTRPTDKVDPLITRLHALAQENPELKSAAELYAIILPLTRDADLNVTHIGLTPQQAREKMEQGLPLLHDAELAFDEDSARELLLRLARASEKTRAANAIAARQIRLALERGELDAGALWASLLADDRGSITALAQNAQLDGALLWTLAQNAFKPALRVWAKQLMPLTRDLQWTHGYCVICGAGATLAELQGNEQEKHLRCGQCGADWLFRRFQCIYCGNDNPKTLAYFELEGKTNSPHVQVCDNCKGYLKVVYAFSPESLEMIIAQDLATLPLDYIAQERGYARVAIR